MSDDQNTPKTTNRPSKRRGFKPGLVAAAVAGALLVPAAAVTIAAEPWANEPAVAVGAYGEDKKDDKTVEEAEAELRECVKGLNLNSSNVSEPNDLDIATLVKAVRCLELVDGVNDPDSPLTEEEAKQLVMQALQAAEAAGFDREQIPGVLRVLDDTGLVKPLAGDTAAALVSVMAESKVLEDYGNREIKRDEAAEQIAEVVVITAKESAK